MNYKLFSLFASAMLNENMALYYFLGTCPLISLTSSLQASFNMGVTVVFVMVVTSAVNWAVYNLVLVPLALNYLQLLFFVLTIAAVVQFIESFLDRFLPAVYADFGIFLPLIAVNCAILGVSLFSALREYSFFETVVYALGSGVGWCFVICLIASIKRRISLNFVPSELGKIGITMIIASVMALTFAGFADLGGNLI